MNTYIGLFLFDFGKLQAKPATRKRTNVTCTTAFRFQINTPFSCL